MLLLPKRRLFFLDGKISSNSVVIVLQQSMFALLNLVFTNLTIQVPVPETRKKNYVFDEREKKNCATHSGVI